LNGFGAVRLYAGAPADSLDPLREAVRRADQTGDAGARVAFRYTLFTAYFIAGRMRDGLAIAEEGLLIAQGDLDLGAALAGFSPILGLAVAQGVSLSVTGRAREGAAALDRAIELARPSQQLHVFYIAHSFHVIRCDITGEATSALAHGREGLNYAERTGSQTSRIFASLQLGLANVLSGAWHDALDVLETALAIARERHLLAFESGVLATMAAAQLGLGEHSKALEIADEAIATGRRFGTPFREISALLVRMRALRESLGIQASQEILTALAEADAWMEMSGATSYRPFLHVERAELARLLGDDATRRNEYRTAHRLFVEIGAPIRAAAIAGEIDR
jgi:tetratricopeptide (TPR) repeat protein